MAENELTLRELTTAKHNAIVVSLDLRSGAARVVSTPQDVREMEQATQAALREGVVRTMASSSPAA